MSATKLRVVWNMRVRSNEKTKPKGNQHQENGKTLFTETSLYSGVQGRLSNGTMLATAVTAVAGVDVAAAAASVLAIVSGRR